MLRLSQEAFMMATKNKSCNFEGIPLSALGFKARDILCKMLDKVKILLSAEGLPRDYRGLAQLAKVGCDDIRNPTLGVISLWSRVEPSPSFQDLIESLERLDRWDVISDVDSVLQVDALNYSLKQKQSAVNTLGQLTSAQETDNIVTYDDADLVRIGLPPNQRYDAYLLYADQDEDIAENIVFTLENNYHLKICVKDRDIIPGAGFEHEAITYLISERCNWLIVVLTPNFIDCPAQKFIYNYSVAMGLYERKNKIIPCLFRLSSNEAINMKLRKVTYSVMPVNFTRDNPFASNWDKLNQAVLAPRIVPVSNSRAIEASPAPGKIEEISASSQNLSSVVENNSEHICEQKLDAGALSAKPDRPPRSKNKHPTNGSLANGISDSQKYSSEISKESCSSNSSTTILIPPKQNKTQTLSITDRIVNDLKKTKIATTCKNMLKKKKKKKKKIAEAVPT